jgi:hypothetical protein
MRNPILIAIGVAILCISCTSCHQGDERRNPLTGQPGSRGPGEIDPHVDYTQVGSCYGSPTNWVKETNPSTQETGRVCSVEVESLAEYVKGNYGKCDYTDHYATEPTAGQIGYHDAIQLNIPTGDHVYFWSKQTLANGFRVRRLLRTTEDQGKNCKWPDPFKHAFQKNAPFWPNDNSLMPNPEPVDGCEYKLEVQIETQALGNPSDPDNGGKRYLCYDPHIKLNSGGPAPIQ